MAQKIERHNGYEKFTIFNRHCFVSDTTQNYSPDSRNGTVTNDLK